MKKEKKNESLFGRKKKLPEGILPVIEGYLFIPLVNFRLIEQYT